MASNGLNLICPQGHGAGVAGSRFCTWCGAALVAGAAQEPAQAGVVVGGAATATDEVAQSAFSAVAQVTVADPPFTPIGSTGFTPVASAPQPIAASVSAPAAEAVAPTGAVFVPAAPMTSLFASRQPAVCAACGGNGARLKAEEIVCMECNWLRPLLTGYAVNRSVFLWAQDGQAMMKLQKIPALHAAVRAASDKVGRPWIESTFNGIRLGPRQLPEVWHRAVLAARILGLPAMPDVYVSGDSQWNTYTFGSDKSAFIVLGTALLTNFQNDELLFVLAREMGHCAAGHALWKTVTRFLSGDNGPHSVLAGGFLGAISPTKLLEGAVEIPLMAWARQSEITADRAGLLAVGDEALARQVLLAWSIRSARLLKQINIEEWMKQEDESDDKMTRFSEMATSASMYTTRRLRLMRQAASEQELMRWSQSVQGVRKRIGTARSVTGSAVASKPGPGGTATAAAGTGMTGQGAKQHAVPAPSDHIRVVCNKCQAAMRVPLAVLRGKTELNVRCPQCQAVLTMRPKAAAAAGTTGQAVAASAERKPESISFPNSTGAATGIVTEATATEGVVTEAKDAGAAAPAAAQN